MKNKLTLDKAWELCLAQWKWVAEQIRAGTNLDVQELKKRWCKKHAFANAIAEDCFFCEYKYQREILSGNPCRLCPAKRVGKAFNCHDDYYHYYVYPLRFYAEVRRRNKIRLARKKK